MKKNPPMTSTGKGAQCHWCLRYLHATSARTLLRATRDHLHPKSKGAGMGRVWCCYLCNQLKADMDIRAWAHWMHTHPRWWEDASVCAKIGIPKDVSFTTWRESHLQLMRRVEEAVHGREWRSGDA